MGRKRVANPRISFSISMSQTMKQQIDHQLSFNSDRSKWICSAIRMKLKQEQESADAVGQASMAELLSEMNWRANHPAFKSMFTKGDKEKIVHWQQKAKELTESGESE